MQFSTLVILAVTLLSAFNAHPAPAHQVDLVRRDFFKDMKDAIKKKITPKHHHKHKAGASSSDGKVHLPSKDEVEDAGFKVDPYYPKPSKVGQWHLLGMLGSGGRGSITAELGWNGNKYGVVMIIKPPFIPSVERQQKRLVELDKGIAIQSSLKGIDNVVQILDFIKEGDQRIMVLEATNPEGLDQYLEARSRGFSEEEAKPIFRQLVEGLMKVHAKNIAIRNIKPANILLVKDGTQVTAKYGNFGLVSTISPGPDGWTETSDYGPPESFENKSYDLVKGDVYALGGTLYTMLTDSYPPREMNLVEMKFGALLVDNEHYKRFTKDHPDAASLVTCMMDSDPTKRCELKDVLKDKWFTSGASGTSA